MFIAIGLVGFVVVALSLQAVVVVLQSPFIRKAITQAALEIPFGVRIFLSIPVLEWSFVPLLESTEAFGFQAPKSSCHCPWFHCVCGVAKAKEVAQAAMTIAANTKDFFFIINPSFLFVFNSATYDIIMF